MIAEGLDTLKNMAHDMNEVRFLLYLSFFLFVFIFPHLSSLFMYQIQELDRQVPLMDEIDTKVRFVNFCLHP